MSSASLVNSPLHGIFHWEEKARHMLLTTTRVDHIHLICSIFPFKNPDTRGDVLSERDELILDNLWKSLPPKNCNTTVKYAGSDIDIKLRKAREFLQRIDPDPPASPVSNQQWSPPGPATLTALEIADRIDAKMNSWIEPISFIEFGRAAAGHPSLVVKDLLERILNTRHELRRHVEELYQPKDVYVEVEKILKYRNPAAYWVVSTSLSMPKEILDPSDALSFIFLPIQEAFKGKSLKSILKRLQFLAELYKDMVTRRDNCRWESLLVANLAFPKIIRSNSPGKMAGILTDEAHQLYRLLCVNDMTLNSMTLQKLISRWFNLVGHVKACCLLYESLVERISEILEMLFLYQNDFSFMAMFYGLCNAECFPEKAMKYKKLIEIDGIYAAYRKESADGPRLLFLLPYIEILENAKNDVDKGKLRYNMFRFVSYPGWQSFGYRKAAPTVDSLQQPPPARATKQSQVALLQQMSTILHALKTLWQWIIMQPHSLLLFFGLRRTSTTVSPRSDVEMCLPHSLGAQDALPPRTLLFESDS